VSIEVSFSLNGKQYVAVEELESKGKEVPQHVKIMEDLLWSDPKESIKGWKQNRRYYNVVKQLNSRVNNIVNDNTFCGWISWLSWLWIICQQKQ
jgi:hypothetical protein